MNVQSIFPQATGTATVSDAAAGGKGFAEALAAAAPAKPSPAEGKADVVVGRLGVDYNKKTMKPERLVIFDENGNKQTQTSLDAKVILKVTERLGVPLDDLTALADKLDALGVKYKPYEMYAGTGSDAGVDLRDLAAGGLGSANDWRVDTAVGQKGDQAAKRLAQDQAMAERLQLTANPEVTTGGGLRVDLITPRVDKDGVLRNFVVTNGGWAGWYRTEAEAQAAATATRAAILTFAQAVGGD